MSASGTPATQGVKEEKAGDGFVTIKVQNADRFRVMYTMRRTGRLQALFHFYYESVPTVVDRDTCRFLVDGRRMQGWQTPADFDMEDGDRVDVIGAGPEPTTHRRPMSASGTPATHGHVEVKEEVVRIKVQENGSFRFTYTMRKTDKLQALFDFYYDRVPTVHRGTGRFFVDDRRLQGWQTPADFNMGDDEEVDVFTELLGGDGRLPV
ncbi:unnamed protein product [Alopecurus aequalis]